MRGTVKPATSFAGDVPLPSHFASHVTIIRPPSVVSSSQVTITAVPAIGMAYLIGTLTVFGIQVSAIDAVGEAVDGYHGVGQFYGLSPSSLIGQGLSSEAIVERLDKRCDIVGISVMFSHEWPYVKRLIESIRQYCPTTLICAGGEHVSAASEFCLLDCPALDVCVVGEGEETFLHLVAALELNIPLYEVPGLHFRDNYGLHATPRRPRIRSVDDIPPPSWDQLHLSTFLDRNLGFGVNRGRSMPILSTRGCPYRCSFCSSSRMWTTQWRARDVNLVIEEIESYIDRYQIDNVDFYDLTAIVNKRWIIAFCKKMIDRNISLTWQLPSGTRSEALDREVLSLMYRAQCRNISYAPESGSRRTLKAIKKKIDPGRMLDSIREAKRIGFNLKAQLIVGFPDETLQDLLNTIMWAIRGALAGLDDLSVWIFSPYPGSELYDRLRKEGKIREMDAQYFASLLSYADLKNITSYNERFSSFKLNLLRFIGWVTFYMVRFTVSPLTFARLLYNLLLRRHDESRLALVLRPLLSRLHFKLRSQVENVRLTFSSLINRTEKSKNVEQHRKRGQSNSGTETKGC